MAPRNTKTIEELMKTSRISDRYWNEVDASIWYNEPSLEETNEIALTTYTARKIADYTDSEDMQGLTLLAAFQEDLEDWDETRFSLVNKEYRRALRLLLRKRGIYTADLLGKIAPQLAQILNAKELPIWPEREFMDMQFDKKTSAFERKQENKAFQPPLASPRAATLTPPHASLEPPYEGLPTLILTSQLSRPFGCNPEEDR